MQLLVIRHAKAEDRGAFAASGAGDADRPLTRGGQAKMRKAARGLAVLVDSPECLASSPLKRAVQTAQILGEFFPDAEMIAREELLPDASFESLVQWLGTRDSQSTIAVVGHEPHLGRLVSWLLAGESDAMLELKKGSACLLESDGKIAPGRCMLKWLLTRRQLSCQK